VVVATDVSGIGLLEFERIDVIRAAGAAAARAALAEAGEPPPIH
jgi:hypothetical protein